MPEENTVSQKRFAIGVAVAIFAILALLFFASWILSRGVEDDSRDQIPVDTPSSSQAVPGQPNNSSESTGGNSAGGTDTSNDPSTGTPSPAGGVDTNGVPAPAPTP